MPQLDIYNFFPIIFCSFLCIIFCFVFFQKYWLYSWKFLSNILVLKNKKAKFLRPFLLKKIQHTFFFLGFIIKETAKKIKLMFKKRIFFIKCLKIFFKFNELSKLKKI